MPRKLPKRCLKNMIYYVTKYYNTDAASTTSIKIYPQGYRGFRMFQNFMQNEIDLQQNMDETIANMNESQKLEVLKAEFDEQYNEDTILYDNDTSKDEIKPINPVISPPNSKFCRVCILGTPNAGKSVLMNTLVNHKVSAISAKLNTTRENVFGCLTHETTQIEFVDTPGILPLTYDDDMDKLYKQRDKNQKTLHYDAWNGVYISNIVILLIDPSRRRQVRDLKIAEQLNVLKQNNSDILQYILCVNKRDLFKNQKDKLIDIAALFHEKCQFDHTCFISAKKGTKVGKLRDYLLEYISNNDIFYSNWKYNSYIKTNLTKEEEILECIREKLYKRTHQEIPYATELKLEYLNDNDINKIDIQIGVYVSKRSHQVLLNGSAKTVIKKQAAKDLENRFGRKVYIYMKIRLK